jgi:heptosyltransferase-2
VHQVEYYRALARGLGLPEGDAVPRLVPDQRTHGLAAALALAEHLGDVGGGALVGFAPGAAYGHAKRWPTRYVADVITSLSAQTGATCVLFGAGADQGAGREIESALRSRSLAPGRLVNLIGRTDLRRLIGLLVRCAVFVTNDSFHAPRGGARDAGRCLFGPTDERVTAPRGGARADVLTANVFCRPCMLRDCPIDHRCMKRITPDHVLAAITGRLDATNA